MENTYFRNLVLYFTYLIGFGVNFLQTQLYFCKVKRISRYLLSPQAPPWRVAGSLYLYLSALHRVELNSYKLFVLIFR
jgi:hypothetical protein